MRYFFIIFFVSFSSVEVCSDIIRLNDGSTAEVNIKDSSGCYLIYERNGNILSVKKALVGFIVAGLNDTIFYDGFKCDSKEKRPDLSKYYSVNKNRNELYDIIVNLPSSKEKMEGNYEFHYLPYPLKSNKEDIRIDNMIIKEFKKLDNISIVDSISLDDISDELKIKKTTNRYVFLALTIEIGREPRDYYVGMEKIKNKREYDPIEKKWVKPFPYLDKEANEYHDNYNLTTVFEYVLLDLKEHMIILHGEEYTHHSVSYYYMPVNYIEKEVEEKLNKNLFEIFRAIRKKIKDL